MFWFRLFSFYSEQFYTVILIILQFPGVLAYCMSKSAIDQFTRCVALGSLFYSAFLNVSKGLNV